MHLAAVSVWFFLSTARYVTAFCNLCHGEHALLPDDECADLHFEAGDKETRLSLVELRLEDDVFTVAPKETAWNDAYLRVTVHNNRSQKACTRLEKGGAENFCLRFAPELANETLLVEFKAELFSETGSRRFLLNLPPPDALVFPYVDFTDTARLILRAQKMSSSVNVSYYQAEAFKVKKNTTRLLDLRLFRSHEDVFYDLYTYNDEGDYFFTVTVLSDGCEENVCARVTTPTVYIGRKSTRLVIGIVGASFILPFILFLFHVLTKRYPLEENHLEAGVVLAYKSSFEKHDTVVKTLASLLEHLGNQVELVDLTRTAGKRIPEKLCVDVLLTSARVVYVASPKSDSHNVSVDKALSQREIFAVVFDYCSDKLPQTFEKRKVFRLFDDFDGFLKALNVGLSGGDDDGDDIYEELRRKTEEARIETERRREAASVPKIVVTVDEPQESDSLMASQVAV